MGNGATALTGDIETKARGKRATKIRRTDEELQHDILKYKELLMRDQGLELDIPPKRAKSNEKEQEIKTFNNRQSSRSSRYRNRRFALEDSTVRESSIRSQNKINEAAKGYEKLKPKYFNQRQKKLPRYESSYNQDKISPPSLTDINNFRKFEDKVLLSHSYQDLIKLLKSEINIQKVDDNEKEESEAIDIPLLWNFFPKNIDAEKKRFDISDPYSFDFQYLNLSSTNLFCSEDIDVFFQKLNDNSNFDQFNEVDLELDAESSIRKNLKKTIPLA
ncbi:uncharacterized protein AC631_04193 [Debaryomyces fabryi]|uniref:Uncharacterized protein n=1 Tax=Debaryomyces fabryi TaxID=58627 RepID=A0A0V1PUV6_9ASCO|nr:uncharacterized protein AC631_04193 [Debaryomyces fabryi]KSA00039.1 hypothetical protein AC631_04193 [Debaryomyces fabryi]CUM45821.1 unnamed protein product [Debaryomyces fabryi]